MKRIVLILIVLVSINLYGQNMTQEQYFEKICDLIENNCSKVKSYNMILVDKNNKKFIAMFKTITEPRYIDVFKKRTKRTGKEGYEKERKPGYDYFFNLDFRNYVDIEISDYEDGYNNEVILTFSKEIKNKIIDDRGKVEGEKKINKAYGETDYGLFSVKLCSKEDVDSLVNLLNGFKNNN